jgi:hypothetical protein
VMFLCCQFIANIPFVGGGVSVLKHLFIDSFHVSQIGCKLNACIMVVGDELLYATIPHGIMKYKFKGFIKIN